MICDIHMSRYLHDALQSLTIPTNNSVQSDMSHSNQGHWEESAAIQQLVMLNAIVACTTTGEFEIYKRSFYTLRYILGTTTNWLKTITTQHGE